MAHFAPKVLRAIKRKALEIPSPHIKGEPLRVKDVRTTNDLLHASGPSALAYVRAPGENQSLKDFQGRRLLLLDCRSSTLVPSYLGASRQLGGTQRNAPK